MYFDVPHLLTKFHKERCWIPPDLQDVFLLYQLFCPSACLWIVSYWWFPQMENCSTTQGRHPWFMSACSRQKFAWAPGFTQPICLLSCVSDCFLGYNFNLLSLFEEQLLSTEWEAATREWEGLLAISNCSSLSPCLGPVRTSVGKWHLHVNHFLHSSKGKWRMI